MLVGGQISRLPVYSESSAALSRKDIELCMRYEAECEHHTSSGLHPTIRVFTFVLSVSCFNHVSFVNVMNTKTKTDLLVQER
jgi:hypothetical protein